MAVLWKILGGVAGFAVGGPLGALIGVAAGHGVDSSRDAARRQHQAESHPGPAGMGQNEVQTVYVVGVVALAAKLAKADGTVTKDEVAALHQVLPREIRARKEVAQIYDEAKRSAHGFEEYAAQLASMFGRFPSVLESIYALLFTVAIADGNLHPAEKRFLEQVADIFGLPPHVVESVEEAFRVGPDAAKHTEQQDLAILGLRELASDEDVRKAYRKLAKDLHPDLLVAQGMPEEFVENAQKRLAEINAAHDRIRKRRARKG